MTKSVPTTLADFFAAHPRLALAFSGGADSAYLLYAALTCGCDVKAYYVQSAFQPEFERKDAERLAVELGARVQYIPLDALSDDTVRANPVNRCYYCKQRVFSAILKAAKADGYDTVIDGTNASDDAGDRPGMKALEEMKVLSPLRLCGVTKPRLREYSRRAGLFTWDKPAYACLATRVPTGTPLTGELLQRVEGAEDQLFKLGFTDFRCRVYHHAARLQFRRDQLERAVSMRDELCAALKPYFDIILLDTEVRG